MSEILIKWDTAFETGNKTVDKQHERLFELIKEFATAYMLNMEKEVVAKMLFYLEDYAKIHFDDEEKILGRTPGLPSQEHLNAHEQFRQYLYDLKFQYVSDDIAITQELLDFLVKWLKNHILVMDKMELGA